MPRRRPGSREGGQERAERCFCLDGCVLGDNARGSFSWRGATSLPQNIMKCERHSLFTERTHSSAKAFKFGLRGGSRRHLTPPVASVFRKSAQNFASQSCST